MQELGEYLVLKEGDQTPLGVLLLAEHRILKRKAALKRVELSLEAPAKEALEEKIPSLAALEHPHVARLQNVQFCQNSCYFAYDWMGEGESACRNLLTHHRETPLLEKDLLAIAKQISSAIDAIHNKGLYHLGVKASNVLLRLENGQWMGYLTDTGLAHLFPSSVFLLHLLKGCVQDMGQAMDLSSFWESFYAVSPEQKRGEATQASDVYAFGVMMYRLLMGSYPEGRFILPSQEKKEFLYDWDGFFIECLQTDPVLRPRSLSEAIEKVASGSEDILVERKNDPVLKPKIKPGAIERPEFEPDPGAVFQSDQMVARYQVEAQEVCEVEPIPTKMVVIPGGVYHQGSNGNARDESPRHSVTLSPFAMEIHPVTNEQYARFLEVMGGEKDRNNCDMIRLRESRIKRNGGKIHIESGYNKHPVVGVTWYGALAYAKWVGKRLPTEAEWEVAMRGGDGDALYSSGEEIDRSQANFFSSDTTAVMSYPSNGYGLYDMAGNVYEWCFDWYDYNYYMTALQEPDNPKGPAQGVYRVLRGGCWKSLKEDMRCSHRHRNNPGTVNSTYGFRCAADVVSS